MEILQVENGTAKCKLKVDKGVQNSFKTLHGGASATLIDVVGTIALLSVDPTRPGVSVEINASYCSAAKAGEVSDKLFIYMVLRRFKCLSTIISKWNEYCYNITNFRL